MESALLVKPQPSAAGDLGLVTVVAPTAPEPANIKFVTLQCTLGDYSSSGPNKSSFTSLSIAISDLSIFLEIHL